MKVLYGALLSCAWACCAVAQTPHLVSGRVTEAGTSVALSDVEVSLPELHLGTVSDSTGRFVLSVPVSGRFVVQFTRLGHESRFMLLHLGQDDPAALDVQLVRRTLELRQAEVIGTQVLAPERVDRSVVQLAPRESTRQGALSLSDAIATLPGVSQLTTGPGISKPVVRGLSGNRVQVNMLGQRFDNQQWQDEHGLGLSDLGIGSVQVIKGPAALQYGSDAVGGVVNVREEAPAPVGTRIQQARLGVFGNTGGISVSYGMRRSGERNWWRLAAGADSHGDYAEGGGQRVLNSRFAQYNAKASYGWRHGRWTHADHVHLSFSQFGFVFDTLARSQEDPRYSRSFAGPHHQVGFVMVGSENVRYGEVTKWTLNAGLNTNRRQEQEGGNTISLDMLLNSASLLAQAATRIGPGTTWTNGVALLAQDNTNFGSRIIVPDAGTLEAGLFSFIRSERERLTVEAGVRLDGRHISTRPTRQLNPPASPVAPFDRTWTTVNGSVGLAWQATEKLRFRLNASTGFRSANLAELSSNGLHEGTSRFEIGDPDLDLERVLALELGGAFTVRNWLDLDLSAYRNAFQGFIFLAPTGTEYIGFPVHRFLQQDATLQGGEAGIGVHPEVLPRWELTASYATVRGTRADGQHLPFMPADRVRTDLRYSPKDGAYLRAGVQQVLEQDRPAEFETRTPSYTLLALGAGIRIERQGLTWDLAVYGNNLTDARYVDHLSRYKYLGFFDMGRNVGLSLQLTFH
ncbi:MAG TPA: TonB-dependent receptor [Flavobacteriales bacterium]|nr:TonB-dependent receptor [Flavobacteriales bacterium]